MNKLPPLLGALGIALTALIAGFSQGGEILGPERVLGDAWVQDDGGLLLAPGSLVVLGQGELVSVRLDMGEADLDIVHGPVDAPWSFAHFDAEGMGLFDGEGQAMSRGTPQRWEKGQVRELTLRCRPPLLIEVDGRSLDVANGAQRPCPSGPISVSANSAVRLQEAKLNGRPVGFALKVIDWQVAGAVAAALVVVGALLGFGTLAPLIAAPYALGALAFGVPMPSALCLLVGAATAMAVVEREGWRRGLAGLLTAAALVGAGGFIFADQDPMGIKGGDSELVAKALSRTVDLDTFMNKVDDAVTYYGPRLESLREDPRPLVVALGSSSTGGNSHGRFWPEVVAELVPEAKVQRLSWGGMTTWHVRHLLDRLDVHAEVCVLYMGHNDLTPTSPGGSLAQIEAGTAPGGRFVSPVPLEDAKANLSAISQHCGTLIAMQERSTESEAALATYKAMLQAHPDLVYADGAATLDGMPFAVAMVDPVHPSPKGHQVLGAFVAERVREALGGE
ncbi:MAG: SGNH/GDSL hydrolase family protein [Alphaproteobacteria bacterium]|nr:SGNH/GDSL hydrolase family protein [Alphaproteobacteria bacterium]MCB9794401.1 SGNH/GDSL hydrolase family protein [Alphaproteobacteria bacterium]